jgi:uncharacterized membrane protein
MLEDQRASPVAEAPPPGTARRLPDVYRDPVTWVIALAVSGAYAAISLFRLLQLNPSSWDLAIYTEYVKQLADLRPPVVDVRGAGFNLLGDHFQPLVAVLVPFFRVFPSPATLLVAQALLAGLSVFPVTHVAREKLGVGTSRAIAAGYGLSWGLQQMANFDFHEIAFAVPLLAFSLSALARGRVTAAVLWALPLVFVKEDQGFTVAAVGGYLVVSGLRAKETAQARRRVNAGQFLIVWGLAWSFLAIGVILPHFSPAHHYDYWSDGGVMAPGGHPSVAGLAGQLFRAWPDKLQTIVLLLLPTAFIALGSPVTLIAVPSLLLRFLSTNSSYWGTYWHYNATVMPIIFVAAVDAMARVHGLAGIPGLARVPGLAGVPGTAWATVMAAARRYGAAMMLAITVPLAFQFPLSKLWQAQTYRISQRVESDDQAMAKVPDGATVLTTLDLLAPLAARTDTFWIGNAGNPRTEYIVFDGQDSDYNPPIGNVPALIAGFYPGHAYTQIFASGDVYVFRLTANLRTGGLTG